jgi:hypothetical protein
MGKINFGRVILGGIVAGIVGDILGYLHRPSFHPDSKRQRFLTRG